MVFTANAGLVRKDVFIPSQFKHPERHREETHFRKWFLMKGYRLADLTGPAHFEGEGDALFQPGNNLLWWVTGFEPIHSHATCSKSYSHCVFQRYNLLIQGFII